MKSKRILALILGAIIASGSVSQAAIQVYADLEDPSAFASMSDSFLETTKAEYLTKMTNLNGSKFEELLRDKSIHINSENLYISGSELVFKLLENNEAKLVCYGGDQQNVTVPQYVSINDKAYPVTSIGARAFDRCTNLQSIVLPKGVTKISAGAFSRCTNLQSIVLPDGVTEIGDRAFQQCKSLKSIRLPNSITEIGNYAFAFCINLPSVYLPEGVTYLGSGAFAYCTSLKSIRLPNSITEIGKYAFTLCINLPSVYLPDDVTKISESTFAGCINLKSIYIPKGVTEIGKKAFANTNIADIYIPASVTTLEENALEAEKLELVLVNEMCNLSDSDIQDACGKYFYKGKDKNPKEGKGPKTVAICRDINMDTLACAIVYEGSKGH